MQSGKVLFSGKAQSVITEESLTKIYGIEISTETSKIFSVKI